MAEVHIFVQAHDVKAATGDLLDMYFLHPMSMLTVHVFGLKELNIITPDMVSLGHLIASLFSGIALWNDKKWLAAFLWFFGLYLDCVDGDLARARRHMTGFSNDYSSFGYQVDIWKDILCGVFFLVALLKHVLLRSRTIPRSSSPPPYTATDIELGGEGDDSDDRSMMIAPSVSSKAQSAKVAIRRCLTSTDFWVFVAFALQTLARSSVWDSVVHQYHDLLETDTLLSASTCDKTDTRYGLMQAAIFSSHISQFVFIMWRFSAAIPFYHITWAAYLLDRVTEFMWFSLRYGWWQLFALVTVTYIHIVSVKVPLEAYLATC
eukprot:comp11902_c0_seq1/m.6550 comp11902_c0_seq1/g.6550  ORF comp11902_c0_seq1/g.6550 comp11902_c0_seq1/m.6550 type:complete len:320 (-) comp11902_c0_seq1:612-1571(-)